MPTIVYILIPIGVVLIPLVWIIAVRNRFVALRQHIRESWSDIDVQLKRRYDLIPNLIQTVKGYADHEKVTLEQVVKLRNQAASSTGSASTQATDESMLMQSVGRLFAVAEDYPELKADSQFLMLQGELADTEDRIAAARRFYNANVREMNQMCLSVPTNIIAGWFGFKPETFFELESEAERVVPRVELG